MQGGFRASGETVSVEQVRDMLGLADRSRILDLLETIISGDHKAALTEAAALLEAGADAPVLIKDLMDVVTEVSRAQALKDAYAYAGPPDWVKRTRAMAEKLSPAQSARMWRLLLQGFEDCARAPDPPAAAQMVVLRLAAAASLPPPEDAMKLLAAGGAVPAPKSQSERRRRAGARARRLMRRLPHSKARTTTSRITACACPRCAKSSTELEAQRKIDLKYEIERYVRPAEIDFGHFNYTAAPGTPTRSLHADQALAGGDQRRRMGGHAVERRRRRKHVRSAAPVAAANGSRPPRRIRASPRR